MTKKKALLKSIAMWEFIKKEHLNKNGEYDLKEYSNIYSKTSIEEAKAKFLCKYEYLDVRNNCYLCDYAFYKREKENRNLEETKKAVSYCQFCPIKNWHIYRDKGKECSTCCAGGSVYAQANKFRVIDDTLELLKENI